MKKFCEAENRRLEKISKFQLPNRFKKIGYLVFGLAIFTLLVLKFIEGEPAWIKTILTQVMLIGLLTVSFAREITEDEMIIQLRSQSFSMAFLLAVLYAIIQPYINYILALFFEPEKATLDMSYFQVLFFMLIVQLIYFNQLKRKMS